jgi:tRNA-splicing ligase RtcB
MSRSSARRRYPYEGLMSDLRRRGIQVRAASTDTVTEEAPGAYKDVDVVAEVTEMAGLAKRVARLIPVGVVKG